MSLLIDYWPGVAGFIAGMMFCLGVLLFSVHAADWIRELLSSRRTQMPMDIAALKQLTTDLEKEAAEAVAAGVDLTVKQEAAALASSAMSDAVTSYKKENDEKLAKMQEIIAQMQSWIAEG